MTETVTKARLADLLALSVRRVDQLVAAKVLEPAPGGGFDLGVVLPAYCHHLRRDEETRVERRKLIRAQTASTIARSAAAIGASLSHDAIRQRLDKHCGRLYDMRALVTHQRMRLLALIDDTEAVHVEASTMYSELSAAITQAVDGLHAMFPPPLADLDDGHDRDH